MQETQGENGRQQLGDSVIIQVKEENGGSDQDKDRGGSDWIKF